MGLNHTFEEENIWPWAIIAFEFEYKLAGRVCSIRRSREDISFSAYSIKDNYSIVESGPPPVSLLFVYKKSILNELGLQSLLFSQSWTYLKDKSESRHWLFIPDPLPNKWVKEKEKLDSKLFRKIFKL